MDPQLSGRNTCCNGEQKFEAHGVFDQSSLVDKCTSRLASLALLFTVDAILFSRVTDGQQRTVSFLDRNRRQEVVGVQ